MPEKNDKIVLDLETQRSFDEVGRNNLGQLGISVVGIYSYQDDEFKVFSENELTQLGPYLERAALIIGFNIKNFDYPVLQPYLDLDLRRLSTLDILEEINASLGFRLSLNNIAKATLKIEKAGSGLDALKYFRDGEIDKLKHYCQHDVYITRQVYEYGRARGHLLHYQGAFLETIPVRWRECPSVEAVLREGLAKQKTMDIEYQQQPRQIDIYHFDLGRIIAYCHLRNDMRTFNLNRILSARLTEKSYIIPADFNLQAFKARQKF